jgi:hypothetical protein
MHKRVQHLSIHGRIIILGGKKEANPLMNREGTVESLMTAVVEPLIFQQWGICVIRKPNMVSMFLMVISWVDLENLVIGRNKG